MSFFVSHLGRSNLISSFILNRNTQMYIQDCLLLGQQSCSKLFSLIKGYTWGPIRILKLRVHEYLKLLFSGLNSWDCIIILSTTYSKPSNREFININTIFRKMFQKWSLNSWKCSLALKKYIILEVFFPYLRKDKKAKI